jgi:hypothetical protein
MMNLLSYEAIGALYPVSCLFLRNIAAPASMVRGPSSWSAPPDHLGPAELSGRALQRDQIGPRLAKFPRSVPEKTNRIKVAVTPNPFACSTDGAVG